MGPLKPGSVIRDYQIKRVLGTGSTSVVYLASSLSDPTRDDVALKVRFKGHGPHEAILSARFKESTRLHHHFCHPNIAWLHEWIEDDHLQVSVLEHLSGGMLTELLERRGGALARDEGCLLGALLADGLDHMHELNIVHRDLKPDNILFARPGELMSVRISDFDVSKNPYMSPQITEPGAHVGTLCYTSPEQFNQEPLTPTADVYGLGMVLYEIFSGRLPFESVNTAAIFSRFLDSTPLPKLSQFMPQAVGGLDWVIERALAIDTSERVPSAATLSVLMLALSPSARSRFTRLKQMRMQAHTRWIATALTDAPSDVQRELLDSLRQMGLKL